MFGARHSRVHEWGTRFRSVATNQQQKLTGQPRCTDVPSPRESTERSDTGTWTTQISLRNLCAFREYFWGYVQAQLSALSPWLVTGCNSVSVIIWLYHSKNEKSSEDSRIFRATALEIQGSRSATTQRIRSKEPSGEVSKQRDLSAGREVLKLVKEGFQGACWCS